MNDIELLIQRQRLTPDPKRRNWALYVVLVLLLAALAAWGSRERSWSKQVETWSTERTTLNSTIASQKQTNEQLQKDSESTETIEPVMVGGQVAYVTHRTSKTVERAMRQVNEQMASLTQQNKELMMKLSSKETETVKSAPVWNIVAGYQPATAYWGGTLPDFYYVGGGMNLGPLSLTLDNPVAFELRPRLTAMIRL